MSESGFLRFRAGELRRDDGGVAEWPALAVLGQPIAHSSSPILHRAALEALGRTEGYERIEVGAEDFGACLRSARESAVRGLNITLPHKQRVVSWVERRSAEVEEVGASNTLVRSDDQWVAHNTDSRGFAMALERMLGRDLSSVLRRVVVLGGGGAARAAVHSLRALGARDLRVAVRRVEAAQWAEEMGGSVVPLKPQALEGARLAVNCTPLGLSRGDPLPVSLEAADSQLVVYDMSYGREPSAWILLARQRGMRAEDGKSMLVAQAALSFSMWYGGLPPLSVMGAAVGLDW